MKKLWNEFKAFAFKGNVLDLAIGMIIGAAFTTIVNALVNSIFMPLLSLITGKVNFEAMKWTIKSGTTTEYITETTTETVDGVEQIVEKTVPQYSDTFTEIPYGVFIQAIFTFLFTALCLFLVIKAINKLMNLKKKDEAPAEEPRLCPFCFQEIHKDATRCPHCTSELPAIEEKK